MKYIVEGFKFYKEFTTEAEGRKCFEEVKSSFNYCELKKVENTPAIYYSKSIEIFRR